MKKVNTIFAMIACLLSSVGYAQNESNFEQLNKACNSGNKQACTQLANQKLSAHDDIDKVCQLYSTIVATYSLNLFKAKDEKAFNAVRPAVFKELAEIGMDKKTAQSFFADKFDFEDKEVRKALAIPYEQRMQFVNTPEFQEQIKQSLQIYYNECVMMYGN